MTLRGITAEDRADLEDRDIGLETAERQLDILRSPSSYADILRPCLAGDGILVVDEDSIPELEEEGRALDSTTPMTRFVPASGAATRMFADLHRFLDPDGNDDQLAAEVVSWVRSQVEGPFRELLGLSEADRRLDETGARTAITRLVDPGGIDDGIDVTALPKALVPFHHHQGGARTALEEQIHEALLQAGENPTVSIHFTAPEGWIETFRERTTRICRDIDAARAAEGLTVPLWEIELSVQAPSTSTLAWDLEKALPARDEKGRLVLRPGGHGSLLRNLQSCRRGRVVVKNIDNIQPTPRQPLVVWWKWVLTALLERIQRALRRHVEHGLDAAETVSAIETVLGGGLDHSGSLPTARPEERVAEWLTRPWRVCGVVGNTGEPGGGPFWVRDSTGRIAPQIVEPPQIAPDRRHLLAASTHFNPVDLVCSMVSPADASRFDLDAFVDPATAFVTEKVVAGRTLRVLENPGLWNGSMAGWNTLFVEVPLATFAPVKTVFDLERPEHRIRPVTTDPS